MSKATEPASLCLNLRSKEMFYKDPSDAPSEHDAEVARLFGTYDATAYWCQCTQTGRGPDDHPANRSACSRAGRGCYVRIEDLT